MRFFQERRRLSNKLVGARGFGFRSSASCLFTPAAPSRYRPRPCGLVLAFRSALDGLRILPYCFKTGRGERIRTSDTLLPKQVRYQAALRPVKNIFKYHKSHFFASLLSQPFPGSVGAAARHFFTVGRVYELSRCLGKGGLPSEASPSLSTGPPAARPLKSPHVDSPACRARNPLTVRVFLYTVYNKGKCIQRRKNEKVSLAKTLHR